MAAEEYRLAGRFPAQTQTGDSYWVLVHQLWFEIDSIPDGWNRWQASGLFCYRLNDGRRVQAIDRFRFVIEGTQEELRRSDAGGGTGHGLALAPRLSATAGTASGG